MMRVAFIGAGKRGMALASALVSGDIGKPVAFWSRTAETAGVAARRFGAQNYDGITEMIRSADPDLVVVATHPSARLEVVQEAVHAGARSLVVEKPVALSWEELRAIREITRGCFVAVNTQYQWMTHWRRILQSIHSGEFGTVKRMQASTAVDLLDQGTHLLSLAAAVASAAGLVVPRCVVATSSGDGTYAGRWSPREIVVSIAFGDCDLVIEAGESAPRIPGESTIYYQQRLEIVGSAATALVSLNQGWHLVGNAGVQTGPTAWPGDDVQAQAAFFLDVEEALHNERAANAFPTALRDSTEETTATRQMALLLGALESAQTGRPVTVDF